MMTYFGQRCALLYKNHIPYEQRFFRKYLAHYIREQFKIFILGLAGKSNNNKKADMHQPGIQVMYIHTCTSAYADMYTNILYIFMNVGMQECVPVGIYEKNFNIYCSNNITYCCVFYHMLSLDYTD